MSAVPPARPAGILVHALAAATAHWEDGVERKALRRLCQLRIALWVNC